MVALATKITCEKLADLQWGPKWVEAKVDMSWLPYREAENDSTPKCFVVTSELESENRSRNKQDDGLVVSKRWT
jgi:hypothetical protein